jgi:hypothetical protein
MTLKDESHLSAYLDGELEPDDRLEIESAMLGDPELARQVRQLAEVRDLVAGLSRPVAPIDLSQAIDARIGRHLWLDALRIPRPPGFPGIVGASLASLALAASLLIALALALESQQRTRRLRTPQPAHTVAESAVAADDAAARSQSAGERPLPPPPRLANRPSPSSHDDATAQKIRAMLDNPRLRRIFIVTDVIGGGTPDQIESLVQKTPRTDAAYGRITISQGIVIDPLHPKEATVFALVMNDQELQHFQKKLEQSFPERVEAAEADPIVVAQLGDVGRVSVLPGTPASSVVIPRDDSARNATALRSDPNAVAPVAGGAQLVLPFGRPDLSEAARLAELKGNVRAGSSVAESPAPHAAAPGPVRETEIQVAEATSPPRAQAVDGPVSLADRIRAIDLHEPPEIVLVWVTPP